MKNLIALLFAAAFHSAVQAGDPPSPPVTIVLAERQAQAVPSQTGFSHTGGGNIDVVQPTPDSVVITMTGVAVAGGHPNKHSTASMTIDLDQCFDIVISQPGVTKAKLIFEGRQIGALRTHQHRGGNVQVGPGEATLSANGAPFATVTTSHHSSTCGQNLAINDRNGPVTFVLPAGRASLHQSWSVSASHPPSVFPCKSVSAEFAPAPALNPLWISYKEPFNGAVKKDYGFQVTLRVEPETGNNGK